MAHNNVCSFNKYGFCKYEERCRKHHEKNICENAKCVVKECALRHPKNCKFLRDYGYCNTGHDEITELKAKLDEVNSRLVSCEKSIFEKSNQIETLEKMLSENVKNEHLEKIMEKIDTKVEGFEVRMNTMNKCVANKDELIVYLEARVKDLESKIEKTNKLEERVVKVERSIYVLEKTKLGIEFCDFCEEEFQNIKDKNYHVRYTHTFIVNYVKLYLKHWKTWKHTCILVKNMTVIDVT